MNDTAKNFGQLLALATLCAVGGCATWTGPTTASNGALPLPSAQFPPTVRGRKFEPEVPPVQEVHATTRTNAPSGGSNRSSVESPAPTNLNSAIGGRASTGSDGGADKSHSAGPMIVRGQQPNDSGRLDTGDGYRHSPLPVSGPDMSQPDSQVRPAQYGQPLDGASGVPRGYGPPADYGTANDRYGIPSYGPPDEYAPASVPGTIGYANPSGVPGPEFQAGPSDMLGPQPYTGRLADLIVNVREQQTGRFMFGVGVNSDAGLTAQVVLDEYNFDWRRFPRGVDDIINGTAWRGGGQRLRIEAIPGSELQRYMVNFTEPYLLDTNISLNLSGYLYDRRYFDWDEQRLGGRVALGYRITPDLSLTGGLRMENINVNDPRIRGIPELEQVLGDSSLFSGRISLTHDTRDSPFAATQGHMMELSFEQVFGSFDYPRAVADYRRYFLLAERPDGSGRHTLGTSLQAGFSGSQTPLYENFFAGGYSTIRGFRFRSAAPKSGDVFVGGEFSLLGSLEYMFPVTADDMLKGVVFCDYGTIEEEVQIEKDDFRVAVGAGLRISIPAMGPAPIAVDLAVPIAREQTDRVQNFSFFVGFGR